jgi:hypothetical protein
MNLYYVWVGLSFAAILTNAVLIAILDQRLGRIIKPLDVFNGKLVEVLYRGAQSPT